MARAERDQWYFRSRRRVLSGLLDRLSPEGPVLDVGCGPGGNGPLLAPWAPVCGVDRSAAAAKSSLTHGYATAVIADGGRLPFGGGAFRLVTCLDVLEHLPDARGAAGELVRVCRPGGLVVVTVPAFQWLWSAHDAALGHVRRYSRDEVGRLLTEAGLRLRRLTYCLLGAFVPAAAVRTFQRFSRREPLAAAKLQTDVGGFPLPEPLNVLLARAFSQEARWVSGHDLPVGLSVFAAGERR